MFNGLYEIKIISCVRYSKDRTNYYHFVQKRQLYFYILFYASAHPCHS